MVQLSQQRERQLHIVRIISLISATILALACGTNGVHNGSLAGSDCSKAGGVSMISSFRAAASSVLCCFASAIILSGLGVSRTLADSLQYAYSAWGPQYAERLQLTSTQSNLISTTGNLGMYLFGLPLGMFVDLKGPRIGALCGSIVLGAGYLGLYRAYLAGPGQTHLAGLCILMGLTGAGGCIAFLGAMKTAAINFPTHRGTATSFPLAAFGLSAFFFSSVAGLISDDTDEFLLVLTIGSFGLTFLPCFFMRTTPTTVAYTPLPTPAPGSQRFRGNTLSRIRSKESSQRGRGNTEPGEDNQPTYDAPSGSNSRNISPHPSEALSHKLSEDQSEIDSDFAAEVAEQAKEKEAHQSLYADVRNVQMLKYSEFYELWIVIGLLTGIGLMTINNIGNDAQALWKSWDAYDKEVTHDFIRSRQRIHVSIISICSFFGRLLGGIGSDFVVKKLHGSRFWCLFASAAVFTAAQCVGVVVSNPRLLVTLSASTGIAYGILFGVSPTLVAETFGVNGMSQNWGMMTLGPALFGEIFNIIYGRIYDAHSIYNEHNEALECEAGKYCYQGAYWITLAAGILGMIAILWCVVHRRIKERRLRQQELDAIEEEHAE